MTPISGPQLTRLNTVFSAWARHFDEPATRDARLAHISQMLGRTVTTTKALTKLEATRIIDQLQAECGIAETRPAPPRSQRDRDKAGTEGRHDQLHPESTLVSDANIARIQSELGRLGWEQHHLTAFLASHRGPLGGRTEIRTLGDANRVYWALSRMKPKATP